LPHQFFPDHFQTYQPSKNFFPAEIKPFHAMMNSVHRHGIPAAWSAQPVLSASERRQQIKHDGVLADGDARTKPNAN
jgi:hypothetical protein